MAFLQIINDGNNYAILLIIGALENQDKEWVDPPYIIKL